MMSSNHAPDEPKSGFLEKIETKPSQVETIPPESAPLPEYRHIVDDIPITEEFLVNSERKKIDERRKKKKHKNLWKNHMKV